MSTQLLTTLDGAVRTGAWLDAVTERYPAVVLGWESARRLGILHVGEQVWIGDRWFMRVPAYDQDSRQPRSPRAGQR